LDADYQKDDGQQNQKDDGQKNQKDDGQQNQKDDGDKKAQLGASSLYFVVNVQQKDGGQKGKEENQKDDGQQNQKDDGQKNQKDDGQQNQKDDGEKGKVQSVNATEKTITVVTRKAGKEVTETYPILNAAVSVDGKAAPITDLKAGMAVSLRFSADRKNVVQIRSGRAR
jgi:hypothetical protein